MRFALIAVLLLQACQKGDVEETGTCGPNAPCATGYECAPITGVCIIKGGSHPDAAAQITVTGTIEGAEATIEASSPAAVCVGGSCTVSAGAAVTLAAPDLSPGHRFTGWDGPPACQAATATLVVTAAADLTCRARYTERLLIEGTLSAGLPGAPAASSPQPDSVCSGGGCTVDAGATVTLTAPALPGLRFTGWSGAGCAGADPALAVVATRPLHCVAGYEPVAAGPTHTVTVLAAAGGTVSAPALACSAGVCSGAAAPGSHLLLQAAPATDHRFVRWIGSGACDGATAPSLDVVVTAPLECTATFVALYRVEVAPDGADAHPRVEGPGCGGAVCLVDDGAEVVLVAGEAEGARFAGWTGAGCAGTSSELVLRVAGPLSCRARFVRRVAVTGALAAGLTGAVAATSTDPAAACAGATCVVDAGSEVTLVAPTVPGQRLTGWSGCSGHRSGAGLTVVAAAAPLACTASYVPGVSVTGAVIGAAGVVEATSPGGTCAAGSCAIDAGGTVTLVAPDLTPGHRFLGWGGDPGCAGAERRLEVVRVQSSVTCQAAYVERVRVSAALESGLPGSIAVSSTDPSAACDALGCTVDRDRPVTLVAPAVAGHRFAGWSEGCSGVDPAITVLPAGPLHCVATYRRRVTVAGVLSGAPGEVVATAAAPSECAAGACLIDAGADVRLDAPDLAPAHRFDRWDGDPGCAGALRTLLVTGAAADTRCLAVYTARHTVTATVAAGVTGSVTLTSDDAGATPGPHSLTVADRAHVTLNAPTAAGARFAAWKGSPACDGQTRAELTLTVTADVTCTASYAQGVSVSGTVSGATGEVRAEAAAPAECSGGACVIYGPTDVRLTAPDLAPGYRFLGWSGGAGCGGSSRALLLAGVATSVACTAGYVRRVTVAGTAPAGLGQVAVRATDAHAPAVDCSGPSCTVDAGTEVELTAPSPAGYRFKAWDSCGAQNPAVFRADSSKTCAATYARRVAVEGTALQNAGATIRATSPSEAASCAGARCVVDSGAHVDLTTDEPAGWRLKRWTGPAACAGTAPRLALDDVRADTSCSADFVRRFTVAGVLPAGMSGTVAASSNSTDPHACSGATCTIDDGFSVTLAAPDRAGHVFSGWSPAACGTAQRTTFQPAQSVSCTAAYERRFTIAALAGSGGQVTAATTAGGCPGASCTVAPAVAVTLTATADPHFQFNAWTGAGCSPVASPSIVLKDVDAACTATFLVERFTVSVEASPAGSATVGASGAGTCSGVTCTGVAYGAQVNVSAAARTGYEMRGWSSSCGGGTGSPVAVTVTADTVCRATMNVIVTGTATGHAAMSADSSDAGDRCWTAAASASCAVAAGATVTLTAHPDAGYRVSGWSGGCVAGGDSATLTANAPATCAATVVALPPGPWAASYGLPATTRESARAAILSAAGDWLVFGQAQTNVGRTFDRLPLVLLDPDNGEPVVPGALTTTATTFTGAVAAARTGSRNLVLAAADPDLVVASLDDQLNLGWARRLSYLNGTTTVTQTGTGLAAAGDGKLRVVSTVALASKAARVVTLDAAGGKSDDVLLRVGADKGCFDGVSTVAGPAAAGGDGTFVTLRGESSASMFVVKLDLTQHVVWAVPVTYPGASSVIPLGVTARDDGGVVVVGNVKMPSETGINAFYLPISPAGVGFITMLSRAANPAGDETLRAAFYDGQTLFLVGTASDTSKATDLWLVKIASGANEQRIYGGVGFEEGAGGAVGGGGYLLAGTTEGSFGTAFGDLWALRINTDLSIPFTAPSGAHALSYSAGASQAYKTPDPVCLNRTVPPAQTAPSISISSRIAAPTVAHQAP